MVRKCVLGVQTDTELSRGTEKSPSSQPLSFCLHLDTPAFRGLSSFESSLLPTNSATNIKPRWTCRLQAALPAVRLESLPDHIGQGNVASLTENPSFDAPSISASVNNSTTATTYDELTTMRLINTETLLLESFPDLRRTPPYAVLSHTWGSDADEVSLQEMMMPGVLESPTVAKPGFKKIRRTCQIALKIGGLKYAWVDTCFIDKTSSAELSEAINSMFKWYQQAAICFAFLEDWEPDQPTFDHCRWWRRGWTLQELIAPRNVLFFDRNWVERGDLAGLCENIQGLAHQGRRPDEGKGAVGCARGGAHVVGVGSGDEQGGGHGVLSHGHL